jgi:hypothetical protein
MNMRWPTVSTSPPSIVPGGSIVPDRPIARERVGHGRDFCPPRFGARARHNRQLIDDDSYVLDEHRVRNLIRCRRRSTR